MNLHNSEFRIHNWRRRTISINSFNAADSYRAAAAPTATGFTLVEVLVACTLLALVIIPLMRAFHSNGAISQAIKEKSYNAIRQS